MEFQIKGGERPVSQKKKFQNLNLEEIILLLFIIFGKRGKQF